MTASNGAACWQAYMFKWFVYIVQSNKDQGYYIGRTHDIAQRIAQHNAGLTKSLKSRLPVHLIYSEELETKELATKRELQIKSYKGGEAFKKLIKQ
jgi:putative endonuclease